VIKKLAAVVYLLNLFYRYSRVKVIETNKKAIFIAEIVYEPLEMN
jgi:hypothetical protein